MRAVAERQLMDVGVLGREMNAALPYRETVERALPQPRSCTRTSARCRCSTRGTLLSRSRAQGVLTPTLSAECCAYTPTAPCARRSPRGQITPPEGHVCTLSRTP
jgi:hypothetical protein